MSPPAERPVGSLQGFDLEFDAATLDEAEEEVERAIKLRTKPVSTKPPRKHAKKGHEDVRHALWAKAKDVGPAGFREPGSA